MIPTFEEVWKYTEQVPGGAYYLGNAKALYKYASECKGTIVEIGVDQGRSASILMAVGQVTKVPIYLIDSWESCLIENLPKVAAKLKDFPLANVTIIHERSKDALGAVPGDVHLLHIDGDHYVGIEHDCKLWLPRLISGGVVCFHDYDASFEAVTRCVNQYCRDAGWEELGNFDSLSVWRKP